MYSPLCFRFFPFFFLPFSSPPHPTPGQSLRVVGDALGAICEAEHEMVRSPPDRHAARHASCSQAAAHRAANTPSRPSVQDAEVHQNLMSPMRELQEGQFKELLRLKKKLNGRRLDYDYKVGWGWVGLGCQSALVPRSW